MQRVRKYVPGIDTDILEQYYVSILKKCSPKVLGEKTSKTFFCVHMTSHRNMSLILLVEITWVQFCLIITVLINKICLQSTNLNSLTFPPTSYNLYRRFAWVPLLYTRSVCDLEGPLWYKWCVHDKLCVYGEYPGGWHCQVHVKDISVTFIDNVYRRWSYVSRTNPSSSVCMTHLMTFIVFSKIHHYTPQTRRSVLFGLIK